MAGIVSNELVRICKESVSAVSKGHKYRRFIQDQRIDGVSANTNFSAVHIVCIVPRCAVFLESCVSYNVFILVVSPCCVFCFLFYVLSIPCTISFLLSPQHYFCCFQLVSPLAFHHAFKGN